MANNQRVRGFLCTWNCPDGKEEAEFYDDTYMDLGFGDQDPAECVLFSNGVRYCVGQLERGEEGRLHWQFFVYFTHAKTNSAAAAAIGNGVHVEPIKTKKEFQRVIRYCRKLDTREEGPYEWGLCPDQGARSDLKIVGDLLRRGFSIHSVATEYPGTFIQYHRGFGALVEELKEAKVEEREVYILWGPTGTGKSHRAWTKYPDAYPLDTFKWWDGYRGHETVICDEFQSIQIPITSFLRICDKWKCRLPIKGGYTNKKWKRLILTSNTSPHHWGWDGGATESQMDAFWRRITACYHVTDQHQQCDF